MTVFNILGYQPPGHGTQGVHSKQYSIVREAPDMNELGLVFKDTLYTIREGTKLWNLGSEIRIGSSSIGLVQFQ